MGELRSFFVRAGGYRTRVVEAGPGDGPHVMLLHDGAFGTDAMLCWEGVIEVLSRDYHVLAPDLLGWGQSDKLCFFDRSPYEFRLEHIAALCDVLALDRPVYFVGSSFGAEIVVRGAADSRWRWPVRAAVSITGTGGRLYRRPGAVEQLSDYEPSLEAAERLTGYLVSTAQGLGNHVRRRYENSLIPGHWEALTAIRLHNPALERGVPTDDWPEPLKTCDIPILYIEGRADTLLEEGWAEGMATITRRGYSVVVDGAHEPNIDHAPMVATVLKDFFEKSP